MYLSPILDTYRRYIVLYNVSTSHNSYQIIDMLDKVFSKNRELSNLIIHSDQGWQYQHKFYTNKLEEKNRYCKKRLKFKTPVKNNYFNNLYNSFLVLG